MSGAAELVEQGFRAWMAGEMTARIRRTASGTGIVQHGSDSQSSNKSPEKPDEREVSLLRKSPGHLGSHSIDARRQISVLPFADRRESQPSGGLSDPASRR